MKMLPPSAAGRHAPANVVGRVLARARRAYAGEVVDFASYKLLVDSFFSSPASIVISNIVGIFIPIFCWAATERDLFLVFSLVAAVTFALRLATVLRYRSTDHSADDLTTVRAWDREYLLGAVIYSVILGLVCFEALALTDNVPSHIITIVATIAFASGYVARNAARPYFVLIQLFALCGPMTLALLTSSTAYYRWIGVFIAFYIVTNIAVTFSIYRNLLALAVANKTSRSLAETLRHKNVTLDSALNSMTHGLAMFDPDLRLEISNSMFAALYGLPTDYANPGKSIGDIAVQLVKSQTLSASSAGDIAALCERVIDMQMPAQLEVLTEHGQTFLLSADLTTDGGVLMLTEDATARKAISAQIERMAHYDSLTSLANRFKFNEALKKACAAAGRNNRQIAVLYIDLDNFKHVNDSLGHEAGDELLIATAKRVQSFVREGDLAARLGGDEFVLMSVDCTSDSAVELAERIVAVMNAPFAIGANTIYSTTSVGLALAPDHGNEAVGLLRAADIALYAAKAAGRNQVAKYDPRHAEALLRRREIESDLREACRTGSLFLHYQPIVDIRNGHIMACEALMRWKHPEKGMIGPDVFIPIAEQTGLIADMGEFAIRQACADAVKWPEDVSVTVNISAFQFKDIARLIATVKDALLLSRLAPQRLELEVTESLLIEDQRSTLEAIRELRRIGVKFALDDFGVGYSSLAYLARYPFSKVKIDRSFAKNVTTDTPSRSIIEVVCQLARRLGLRVVVEGIETEEQRDEVQRLGAEQGQGWLFGRPEPAENLIRRLARAA